jgi:hypothetical protein
VLPPTATVLAVQGDRGIDQLYRLAVRVDPGAVAELLSGSSFTTSLERGRRVFMPPLPGFDPDNGREIASAHDTLPAGEGRARPVNREILVDHSIPAQPGFFPDNRCTYLSRRGTPIGTLPVGP